MIGDSRNEENKILDMKLLDDIESGKLEFPDSEMLNEYQIYENVRSRLRIWEKIHYYK